MAMLQNFPISDTRRTAEEVGNVILSYINRGRKCVLMLRRKTCKCVQSSDQKTTAKLTSGISGLVTGTIKAVACGGCGCFIFFAAVVGGIICLGACYAGTKVDDLHPGLQITVWTVAGAVGAAAGAVLFSGLGAVLGGLAGAVQALKCVFGGYTARQNTNGLTAVRTKIDTMQTTMDKMEEQNADLMTKMDDMKTTHDNDMAELKRMIASLVAQNQQNGGNQ